MGDERGGALVEGGQPAGLAVCHPRDHVVQRLRRPVPGQQREVGQAEPQHEPQRPRGRDPHGARRGEQRRRPADRPATAAPPAARR